MARSQLEKQKGRASERGYFRLYSFVLRSAEFRALSPAAVKAFITLGAEYNGGNNGSLALPRAQHCAKGFGKSGAQVRKAIRELIASGFIVCTRPGKLKVGVSYYAITIEPIDASHKHPHPGERKASHAWRKNVGTEIVQMPERKPFTCAANDGATRTETVPIDTNSGQPSRTETVHLYKLPSEAGSAAASAAADPDSDSSFKGSESRSAPTKSDEQTTPADRARRQSAKPKAA